MPAPVVAGVPVTPIRPAAPTRLLRLPPPAWTFDFARRPTLDAGPGRPAIAFARPSPGRYVAADGSETVVAAGVPRWGDRGLLIETGRTNAFLNASAPASHTSPALATGFHTLSVDGPGTVAVAANSATGSGFGTASAGSPVTFQLTVGGTVDFTVSGSPTRAQCENGAWPTSFIDTAGSPVARAADSAVIHGVDTAPWYNPAEGTLAVTAEFVTEAAALTLAPTAQFVATFSNGTNSEIVAGFNRNGAFDAIYAFLREAGVNKVLCGLAPPPGPGRHGLATAWRSGDSAFAVDGVLAETTLDDPYTPPPITRLDIGQAATSGGLNHIDGFIRSISYWNYKMSGGSLVSVSSYS
jgi:hypothetical protein